MAIETLETFIILCDGPKCGAVSKIKKSRGVMIRHALRIGWTNRGCSWFCPSCTSLCQSDVRTDSNCVPDVNGEG